MAHIHRGDPDRVRTGQMLVLPERYMPARFGIPVTLCKSKVNNVHLACKGRRAKGQGCSHGQAGRKTAYHVFAARGSHEKIIWLEVLQAEWKGG